MSNTKIFSAARALTVALVALGLAFCGERKQIQIDGSSTVYPITQSVAEAFSGEQGDVQITVGVSGTGGGFKKFCANETDISDASRPIKDSEAEKCAEAGVEFIELEVAYDGLAVLVSKDNDFVQQLTVDQLNQIFRADGFAATWKEVNPAWPDEEIKIFAPGQDSGTFDYFTEAILDKGDMRPDASFSEDDNVLVTGIAGDRYAIGFFGLAYYEENKDKLNLVPVVNPATGAAVQPSLQTVMAGTYAPLSRPLFIYVRKDALNKPEVRDFVTYYLNNGAEHSQIVGYIPLQEAEYAEALAKIQ